MSEQEPIPVPVVVTQEPALKRRRTEEDLEQEERVKDFFLHAAHLDVTMPEITDPMMRAHMIEKVMWMEIEKRMSFSYGLEKTITKEERKVDKIMQRLKVKAVKDDYYNAVIHNYFENKVILFHLISSTIGENRRLRLAPSLRNDAQGRHSQSSPVRCCQP